MRDVFLCHASQDKKAIVEPLIEECKRVGISYWYDKVEILWGDSMTKKINEGLGMSHYVVAIISKSFLGKNWPERELIAVINLEAHTGAVKLVLLLVGARLIGSLCFTSCH